jgi:S-adenosylmethionine:tRNA ribosyltransferase-isomerase
MVDPIMRMNTSDFDYILPPEFIAQTPVEPRDSSRLLVLDRTTGKLEHSIFREIGKYLHPGDLLVINRTRVIPARLVARKPTGGRVEILLLHEVGPLSWECLVGGKGLTKGKTIHIQGGPSAEIAEVLEGSRRRVRFTEPIESYLPKIGRVPLPPYIHTPLRDQERYQTVFACNPGSAAAPTAGLHFTTRLIDDLKSQGIQFADVTLHVGLDTFTPVSEEHPEEHFIHTEWCEIPPETVETLVQTRETGGKIIAIGTTSVRTLETVGKVGLTDNPGYSGPTDLFILPGYQFSLVDAMVTNFHLPKSTLIMMVSAFAGRDKILLAYKVAMREKYRFYSFGDAMLIL